MNPIKSKDKSLPPGVAWDEIEKGLSQGKWDYLHKMMSRSIFMQVLNEKDKSKAVSKVLKALQKTDPKHANEDYAEKMLGWMRKYAKIVLKKKQVF